MNKVTNNGISIVGGLAVAGLTFTLLTTTLLKVKMLSPLTILATSGAFLTTAGTFARISHYVSPKKEISLATDKELRQKLKEISKNLSSIQDKDKQHVAMLLLRSLKEIPKEETERQNLINLIEHLLAGTTLDATYQSRLQGYLEALKAKSTEQLQEARKENKESNVHLTRLNQLLTSRDPDKQLNEWAKTEAIKLKERVCCVTP